MSFYNVGPTTKFVVQNEDLYTQQHIDFLEAGFQQPLVGTSLNLASTATDYTYSANQITNAGYIVRALAGVGRTDVLPSATAIIAALNNNQAIRQLSTSADPVNVGVGFNFGLIINNTSANAITLGSVSISAGINVLKFIVTSLVSGSEAVNVVKLA
jgi:hypothetical protein